MANTYLPLTNATVSSNDIVLGHVTVTTYLPKLSSKYGSKKLCTRCGKTKPVRFFHRRGATAMLQSHCKTCQRTARKAQRKGEYIVSKVKIIREKKSSKSKAIVVHQDESVRRLEL